MEEIQQSSAAAKIEEINIEPSKEVYIPSSTEKKRAVMMYFLIGIIVVGFNNQKKSDFEQFHLKQAIWWRAVFLFLIVVTSIFMFIPLIKYIPIFAVVIMVAFLAIFIKHARDGKYSIAQENKLAIFISLGEWIMILFEVNKETVAWETKDTTITPEIKS